MTKKSLTLRIHGIEKDWAFDVRGNPFYLAEWQTDGIDICVVENTIPVWLPPGWGRVWCFFQDIVNFKNPFNDKGA